jgi:hypothetical protein
MAPVREVLRSGENARLCNFFDVQELSRLVVEALGSPPSTRTMVVVARRDAQRFSLTEGLMHYEELVSVGRGSWRPETRLARRLSPSRLSPSRLTPS